MKKNLVVGRIVILIMIIVLSGCKSSKVPPYKKYVMDEKFINVKGLNIPELTTDRKIYNPPKALKKDMRNSLVMNRISEVYGDNDSAYKKAASHHLIKSTAVNVKSYSYDDVQYDEGYIKPYQKFNITYYYFNESDTLELIQETKMQVLPLKEKIFTGDATYSEYVENALVEYSCGFSYYPNGQLHYYSCNISSAKAGTRFIDFQHTSIGAQYEFDKSGNLIGSINYEDGFEMDFATIMTIALKGRNEILEKYKDIFGGVGLLDIRRNKNKLGSFWIIPYSKGGSVIIYRIINDKTGLVIDEFKYDEQKYKKYIQKLE